MNIVNIQFFLKTEVEGSQPIKRIPDFNPKLDFQKNSFTIEDSFGTRKKVYPKSFSEIVELTDGFNTIDFFCKEFLKKIVKSKAIISTVVKYEAVVSKDKGYIMDCYVNLEGELEELYEKELQDQAKRYFM